MSVEAPRARMSAREIFDSLAERMGLRWTHGRSGELRLLESSDSPQRRPSLVG